MRFNVLIATHGRSDLLRRTLQSLSLARQPDGFEHVWVIENGSDEGARQTCADMASQLPVKYRHVAQAGKSRALQLMVEELKTGFIFLFDDDIRVQPDIYEIYAAAAHEHGMSAFYGGPIEPDYEGDPPPVQVRNRMPKSAVGWSVKSSRDVGVDGNWFLGFNYGAFAQSILKAGGFNFDLGPGAMVAGTENNPSGQDDDMQQKLVAIGCRPVYLPQAIVWHYVSRERCSAQWALHRRYRMSMSKGMRDPVFDNAPHLFGYPRCLWPRAVRFTLRHLASYLAISEMARFEMRFPVYEHQGLMAGYRLRRQMRRDNARS